MREKSLLSLLFLLFSTFVRGQIVVDSLPSSGAPSAAFSSLFSRSSWNIASPVAGAVYQRGQNNTAIIQVKGMVSVQIVGMNVTATLSPLDLQGNALQVPTINIPITTVRSPSAAGVSFTGQLPVPAGWYRLTLSARASFVGSPSFSIPITHTRKVGVGEVFIIAGQSNAQGRDNTFPILSNNVAGIPLLDAVRVQPDRFDEAQYLTTTDPASVSIATRFPVKKPVLSPLISGRDANANTRSGIAPLGNSLWYWVSFGEKIAQTYNVPVAFFNAAWGGTTVKAWQESTNPVVRPIGNPANPQQYYPSGAPYGTFKNTLKFYGSTYGVRSVLWLQGETDAKAWREDSLWKTQRISSSLEYAQKLLLVVNKSRSDLQNDLSWMVGKTSTFEGVSAIYPKSGQT